MFVLVRNKETGECRTLYKKDIKNFLGLDKFFNPVDENGNYIENNGEYVFKFEIIEDLQEIKKILDEEYASKGRGEEYDESLPSVTKIAYSLTPINIPSEKFLFRWMNNTAVTPESKLKNQQILSRGTFLHFILECFVNDKSSRKADKPIIEQIKKLKKTSKASKFLNDQLDKKLINDIKSYFKIAYQDKEIIRKIPNLNEIKEELEYLSIHCLLPFIKSEIIMTDLVYSEIFITIDNYIQGSIDYCCYKDGKFSIVDYKTTSVVDKTTGRPKFKTQSQLEPYARQLSIYYNMLKDSNMIPNSNEIPEFYICQIHLIGQKYKIFNIPYNLIKHADKTNKKVLDWYWAVRNGTDIPKEDCEDYIDEYNELDFITL